MGLIESFSGIRGIYSKSLTDLVAVQYTHEFYNFLKRKNKKTNATIVIGRDTRPSGQHILDSIINLVDANFINVGIMPTPGVEFAVRNFEADGGIMITASHNEPMWNGFKFLDNDGGILSGKDMDILINSHKSFKNFHRIQERRIADKRNETNERYIEFVLDVIGKKDIEKIRNAGLKVVIDPNGGAGAIAESMLKKAGVDVVAVNSEYGTFKRKVEPNEESLKYLQKDINEENADFAAGFDCDADRVEILMKNGEILDGNYILALSVQDVLSRQKEPKHKFVVVNDATSGVVNEIVKNFGAKLVEVEVGETNVVHQMYKLKAVIGGEGSSGGVILPPSRCRDGMMTLLNVLAIIAKERKPLHQIAGGLPKYYTLKAKIEFDAEKHGSIKDHLKKYYSRNGFQIKETGGIKGGLKAQKGNSFVWFRASKTEGNVFRIIIDSKDKTEAENLLNEALKVFNDGNSSR